MSKLMNGSQLLEELFDEECKPSVRWLREQTKSRTIPYYRIGHLVFFDSDMVRQAMASVGWRASKYARKAKPERPRQLGHQVDLTKAIGYDPKHFQGAVLKP